MLEYACTFILSQKGERVGGSEANTLLHLLFQWFRFSLGCCLSSPPSCSLAVVFFL